MIRDGGKLIERPLLSFGGMVIFRLDLEISERWVRSISRLSRCIQVAGISYCS